MQGYYFTTCSSPVSERCSQSLAALLTQQCPGLSRLAVTDTRLHECFWSEMVNLRHLYLNIADIVEDLPKYIRLLPEGLQEVVIGCGFVDCDAYAADKVADAVDCFESIRFSLEVQSCQVIWPYEGSTCLLQADGILAVLQSLSTRCVCQPQVLGFCGPFDDEAYPPVADVVELFPALQVLELRFCAIDDDILRIASCAWGHVLKGLRVHLSYKSGCTVPAVMHAIANFRMTLGTSQCPLRVHVSKQMQIVKEPELGADVMHGVFFQGSMELDHGAG